MEEIFTAYYVQVSKAFIHYFYKIKGMRLSLAKISKYRITEKSNKKISINQKVGKNRFIKDLIIKK